MIRWAILDGNGYPTSLGQGRSVPTGAVALPGELRPAEAARMRFIGGAWTDRPLSPVAEVLAGSVTLTECPAGSYAEIYDREIGDYLGRVDETGGVIEISLPDPGTYLIEVTFPPPYLPSRSVVEVP